MKRTPIVAPQTTGAQTAGDGPVGQDAPRDIPATGEARIDPPLIEPITEERFNAKADELAFMEEPVTIVIPSSGQENEEIFIPVGNNGRTVYIRRNVETTLRRKFVESLLRARKTTYRVEAKILQDGNVDQRAVPATGLLYPFDVTNDTPRGHAWRRKVMAEA